MLLWTAVPALVEKLHPADVPRFLAGLSPLLACSQFGSLSGLAIVAVEAGELVIAQAVVSQVLTLKWLKVLCVVLPAQAAGQGQW